MATETLYLRADEIKPGDVLPDVSRFPVSDIGMLGATDPIRIFFEGTGFTRVARHGGPEYGYECFRVERAPDCKHDHFDRIGADADGADIYECEVCSETWNTGESEEDYVRACDAQHAANTHRFEGEL